MMATIEQGDGMNEYRFTKTAGAYTVTTPTADDRDWRLLDGAVTVHAHGRIVCVALFGEDQRHTASVQASFVEWMQACYAYR